MKNLSLVAILPMLSLVQPAGAETSSAVLEKRCSEQERQIRQLEEENSQLRSLIETSSRTKVAEKPSAPDHQSDAPAASSKPIYYTVAQGDTLSRIARNNDTTPAALAKLNKLKDVGMIRPGQKLKLPQTQVAVADQPVDKATEKLASPRSADGAIHMVKNGETFFGIARKYGLSVETLADANPEVNPRSIRIGQRLQLVSREVAEPVVKNEPTPAPKSEPVLSPSTEPSSRTVTNQPLIRSVRIEKEINFGNFAAAHGMETAKLNALNGLHLESNTVLAKGSELYVSAQP